MGKLLMGMDIGTSACKAALFDPEGNVMCRSTEEYPVYYPAPGYVEQNPLEWWEAVCRAVRRMIDASRVDVRQIAGIGVAGQSWSAIPVDRQGHVLCNTPIWMDTRSGEICREVLEKLGHDRIFQVCGNPFEPTYTTPKILWFREQRPEHLSISAEQQLYCISSYRRLHTGSFPGVWSALLPHAERAMG